MSDGSALDPRELLRLLVEQQANITQLQRLVIEHVLAEGRPADGLATPNAHVAPLRTQPEPLPSVDPPPTPPESEAPSGSGVASTEPGPLPATSMPIVVQPAVSMGATVDDAENNDVDAPIATEATVDPPVPADSPFGESPAIETSPGGPSAPPPMPLVVNPRVSRYLKPRRVASAKQVTSQELHRISRLCDVGDAAQLVLQFGEYRGATLFQVAQADPDYILSLAMTAQRPQVRAAALQLVRALEASERPTGRRRPPKSNAARR